MADQALREGGRLRPVLAPAARAACRATLAADLRDDELEALIACGRACGLPEGEVLIAQGEPSSALYFVAHGRLSVRARLGGEEVRLGEIDSGHWVGEVGFVDGGPATATLVAEETCALVQWRADALHELRKTHPRAASVLIRNIGRELAERLEHTGASTLEPTADGGFRLVRPASPGWLRRTLATLMGGRA
ncbi:MAG: cyclic nucleotide-binding domain-containing protein [Alphaproteobacteria bacterium]|nr:cyclic nucleotide-binding domain-containing protein [Alphaproteobacteria bacterium]